MQTYFQGVEVHGFHLGVGAYARGMYYLTTSEFAKYLNITPRAARYLCVELEQQGFVFETGCQGTRLIPKRLAKLIAALRKCGTSLSKLKTHPDAQPFLKPARANWFDDLVDLRIQLKILQEILNVIANHQLQRAGQGIPCPRNELDVFRQRLACLWAEAAVLVDCFHSRRLNEEIAEILESRGRS